MPPLGRQGDELHSSSFINLQRKQKRTAKYLIGLVTEMALQRNGDGHLNKSALRYRALCKSKGMFFFLDSGNIATYLTLAFGLLFIAIGGAVDIAIEGEAEGILLSTRLLVVTVLLVFVGSYILLILGLKVEDFSVQRDFEKAGQQDAIEVNRKQFGFSVPGPVKNTRQTET